MTNPVARRFCTWSGPVFVVLFFVGFVPLAHFIPPPSPHLSAAHIAAMFRDHTTRIRLGMVVCIFGIMPLISWGIGVAAHTRKAEGSYPAFAWIQVGCVAIGVLTGVIDMVVWGVAAFRPQQMSPATLQLLNDIGWFLFEFAIPPFCLWLLAVGLSILIDRSDAPVFPRWVGYQSLWTALIVAPDGIILFFKHGPFAWNGLIAFYLAMTAFFTWLIAVNTFMFRDLYRHPAREPAVARAPVTVT
jgi:hypothetical protein